MIEVTYLFTQSHRPCRASRVSPEILLSIFRYTTPPAHCTDGTIKLGGRLNNLWLENVRTKKSLTLVCKSWNGAATEALYEHVIETRMGQIVAFARTLRLEDRNHIKLVKSLTLDRLLVLTTCVDVVQEDLDFILSRCSLLKHFAFRDVHVTCINETIRVLLELYSGMYTCYTSP